MKPAFVPFVPSSAGSAPASGPGLPKMLSAASAAKLFHPLKAGEPAGATPHPAGEPKVTVERNGDCITKIKIQCSCGQVIELACSY